MNIRTIIVDDQHDARRGLEALLLNHKDFELVGTVKNGLEAIELIQKEKPELAFLDIQMPGIDGFEVLYSLEQDFLPNVIFTTAFDEFALKAFEVSAMDYLLKPYTDQRFEEALEKARSAHLQKDLTQSQKKMKQLLRFYEERGVDTKNDAIVEEDETNDRFVIKEKGRIRIINFNEILWVEAFDYYSKLHTIKGVHLIRKTMKKLEEELPTDFYRIHRSFIIRADQVSQIKRETYNGVVVLNNGETLNVSSKYWKALKNRFSE